MDTVLQGLRTAVAATSGWEILAVLLALAYLWLATRENILCWYCALVSTAIYTALFWNVSLLMESALNVYYMAMAVYGWYQWRYGGGDATGVAIGTLRPAQHAIIIGAIIVVAAASGYLMATHTVAAWPYMDSFTTWASVVTTVMVARKILENWLYWLVIDSVSIPLYIDRGLYMTALLFVAYGVIVIFGFFNWLRRYRANRVVCAAT